MDRLTHPALHRERLHSDADGNEPSVSAGTLLQLLLHQDGSTTRLLEKLVGGPITVHVLEQSFVDELPASLGHSLPGKSFLRRLTTLEARGHALLDSISYIAADILPAPVVRDLEEGIRPIGHVLADLWSRRRVRHGDDQLLRELWALTGHADPDASRSCTILTPQGACMVLAETFRGGILEFQPGPARAPSSGSET